MNRGEQVELHELRLLRSLFSKYFIAKYVQNTNMKLWIFKINLILEIIFILICDGNYIFISVGWDLTKYLLFYWIKAEWEKHLVVTY